MKSSIVCAILCASVFSVQPVLSSVEKSVASRKLTDFTYHGDGDYDSCDDELIWVGGTPAPVEMEPIRTCYKCTGSSWASLAETESVTLNVGSKFTSSFEPPLDWLSTELGIDITLEHSVTTEIGCDSSHNNFNGQPIKCLVMYKHYLKYEGQINDRRGVNKCNDDIKDFAMLVPDFNSDRDNCEFFDSWENPLVCSSVVGS